MAMLNVEDRKRPMSNRRHFLGGAIGASAFMLGGAANARSSALPENEEPIRTLVHEMYRSICFEKGAWIDGDRMRFLVHPQGTFAWAEEGGVRLIGIDEFIELFSGAFKAEGIYSLQERSLDMKIMMFGEIAQVFDIYEAVFNEGSRVVRGVNAFQLVSDAGQWKCASLAWSEETEDRRL